ncbi:MAG: IS1595 family transposase [Terracidiphilus sp.]
MSAKRRMVELSPAGKLATTSHDGLIAFYSRRLCLVHTFLGNYIHYSLDKFRGVIYRRYMSRSTIGTSQLFAMFPDQDTARVYLESRLWPTGPTCPSCSCRDRITTRKGGFYRCNQCKTDFTVRTGTIFERSHVPLHLWIQAMYLVVTARKGISSMQLAKEIGVTQKTAWFMLQRLREACSGKMDKLSGVIEIDETFVGGKEGNKHASKKLRSGRGPVGKTAVMGLRERGGRTIAMPVENTDKETLQNAIYDNVQLGSTLMTDEAAAYAGLDGVFFKHHTVNHLGGEYTRGSVSTNGIESVWALLKRGIYGTWHQVSAKHLRRYVDEVAFRLNAGNVERHTLDRLDSFVDAADGKRLTYARLIA